MRLAMFCGLALALAGTTVAQEKNDLPKELVPFQGTWKVVKVEFNGKVEPEEEHAKLRFSIVGDKMTVIDGGKEIDRARISADPKKEPAEITYEAKADKKVVGIYRFEKDGRLTMCVIKGSATPPKAFDSKLDKERVCLVMLLEKVKE